MESDNDISQYFSRKTICRTIAGNKCECITITSPTPRKDIKKKGVCFTARAHPGETVGSWMMQGNS